MKKKISEKIFYKIGEVAELTVLEPYVLRYWEGEFNFKLTKSKNHQRLYQKRDIEQIQKIKRLLYEEKFTIAGAKKKLRERKRKNHTEEQLTLTMPTDMESKRLRETLTDVRKELKTFMEALEPRP